jgi:hypothetical protein
MMSTNGMTTAGEAGMDLRFLRKFTVTFLMD